MTRYNEDMRPVIVRAKDAGVHFGLLEAFEGRSVWLRQSHRLWKWKAVGGVALSGVALTGIVHAESKVDALADRIIILDACEIIDATEDCEASIRAYQLR